MDGQPKLVDHFYNDTAAPHFSRAGTAAAAHIPPAYTNWRDEQRAWGETAVLFQQTHHMPELFLTGPDAFRLLERLGINTFSNFTTDRAKQFVACSPRGHVIGDCIAYRLGDDSFELVSGMPVLNWVHYHAETGGYDVKVLRDNHSTANPTGRRVNYRFQLDGPAAGKIFAEAVEGDVPEIAFFRTVRVKIRGREVLVLRHGMAGHQGVELSGPFDDHDLVRDALTDAGEPYGLVLAGTQAYFSTPMVSAWMAYPVPGIYTGEELRDYRQWLSAESWEANTQLGGSFRSPNIEDYYATPYDLGYERIVKFDHDFIGREALENLPAEARRTRRTLVWNRDDVLRVLGSQFGEGPRYKALDFPVAYYSFNHFDEVRAATGGMAGVSCHTGYINNQGDVLSLAMLDQEHAQLGAELVLTWGEPDGGSRKPQVERHEQTQIRATVAPAPYAGSVQRMKRAAVGGKA
ncbi:aminomethyl transferase family protein [Streptomyces sp. NPDC007851]|uniref:aminomethyl transferase family protein n=1 Tax=Streptomyces sp. NPDC007851 TaxID=3155008 RepID=UPI0033CC7DEF